MTSSAGMNYNFQDTKWDGNPKLATVQSGSPLCADIQYLNCTQSMIHERQISFRSWKGGLIDGAWLTAAKTVHRVHVSSIPLLVESSSQHQFSHIGDSIHWKAVRAEASTDQGENVI